MAKLSFLQSKLENITGTDDLRPAMQCVYFKDGFVYATDAHVLIKQSLSDVHGFTDEEIKILDGKMVHRDVLKKLHSLENVKVTEEGIVADLSVNAKATYHYFDTQGDSFRYPNAEAVIPQKFGDTTDKKIKFDPRNLKKLSDGLVGSNIRVEFSFTDGNPIVVTTGEFTPNQQIGILMPVA